jgi:hypothetical protein
MEERLKVHSIPYEEDTLKKDLMNIIHTEEWKCDAYRIEEVAMESAQRVFWLPPYHCELNQV